MLPIQLITCLFTAAVVGATANFAQSEVFTVIGWFMYLYLLGYRTKMFLDDMVYYENIKRHALRGGDPIIGLLSWVLWIGVALNVRNEAVYFGLTAATFGLGVIWILIARRNVGKVNASVNAKVLSDTRDAHRRWLRFNIAPTIISGTYFVLLLLGIQVTWGIT